MNTKALPLMFFAANTFSMVSSSEPVALLEIMLRMRARLQLTEVDETSQKIEENECLAQARPCLSPGWLHAGKRLLNAFVS